MKNERSSYKRQFEFLEFLFSGRELEELKILTSRFNICSIIKRFWTGVYVTFFALNRRNSHRTEFEHHGRLMEKKKNKKIHDVS